VIGPLRRLCSDCCRWVLPSLLTLTATKRLLGTATAAGTNGCCMRYCGRRGSANRLVPRHRPLPHHLNLAARHHWDDARAHLAANAITLHLNVTVGDEHGKEAQMVRAGSGGDVAGLGLVCWNVTKLRRWLTVTQGWI
jgi:hypothetical protein